MPFDNRTTEAPNVDAIAVVDRMAKLLATPEQWCQGVGRKGRSLCVMGALSEVVSTVEERVHVPVRMALLRVTGFPSIPKWNDAPERTHQDILDLLAKVRRHFEAGGA